MEVEIANFIKNRLEPNDPLKVIRREQGNQLKVILPAQRLNRVCRALKDTEPYYFLHLSDITAEPLNRKSDKRTHEVIWHLYSHKLNYRLNLAVSLKERKCFPDLSTIWPSAGWLQQRCFELYEAKFSENIDERQSVYPSSFSSQFKKFNSQVDTGGESDDRVEQIK